MPVDQPQPDNLYFIDSESGAEMARLIDQDHIITRGMGGLFPERPDLSGVQRVLDLACGPGGWALELAFAHPHIQVVGVDISQRMIDYACTQADVQGLNNASFQVMNVLEPFAFPDESFDVVNARGLVLLMPVEAWPQFMRECLRVLRPGGVVRLTDYEVGPSNSAAFERVNALYCQTLYKSGRSFSGAGLHYGLTPMFTRFLREAGYKDMQLMAHVIDFSTGTPSHAEFCRDMMAVFKLGEPFVLKGGAVTPEEYEDLYQRTVLEIQSEGFCTLWFVVTAWGEKPSIRDK